MVFKKIGSRINHPLKIAVRIGVAVPIFLLIIFLWSYYILKAAEPLVKTDNPDSGLLSWNPEDVFCKAQVITPGGKSGHSSGVHSGGGITVSTTTAKSQPLVCTTGNVEYKCDGTSPTFKTSNKCVSGKVIKTSKKWCDVPGLSNVTASTAGSIGLLDQRIQEHCCETVEYHSNINYFGLVFYLVLTVPIIYFLIEKIINGFIIKDIEMGGKRIEKGVRDQFEWIGGYISNNGAKIVILALSIYFIGLPLFRFFFVSYKCEDIDRGKSGICGKSCNNDNNCVSLHGGCSSCINNVCANPTFRGSGGSNKTGNIELSVCSLRSIINDLTDAEINDLYNTFTPGLATTKAVKIKAINTFINTDSNNKKATSYYYRFYPRQEITINDSASPFSIRIPNPTTTTTGADGHKTYTPIPGFDYELNNYINLEDYKPSSTAPSSPKCSSTTPVECNKNHNCKWTQPSSGSGSCVNNTCSGTKPRRYKLPGVIQSINDRQQTESDLDLHNKTIRSGLDYNTSTGTYPDNMYPCNSVVISTTKKFAAKSSIQSTNIDDNAMGGWINHFELKRIECADKGGKCYMNGGVCQTITGVPIPLKNLQHPEPGKYTLTKLTDAGCKHILYPCKTTNTSAEVASSDPSSQPCTELKYSNGYIVESPNTGICRSVIWDTPSGQWKTSPGSSETKMCVPSNTPAYKSSGKFIPTSFPDAKIADWIDTPTKPVDTQCKSVNRMPRSNISDHHAPSISHYYRWNNVSTRDNLLCSDWKGNCAGGNIKKTGATYTGSRQQEMCCMNASGINKIPVSLYATGTGVATPITVGKQTINPTPLRLCSEWTGKCSTGKGKKSGTYTAGQESTDCCQ